MAQVCQHLLDPSGHQIAQLPEVLDEHVLYPHHINRLNQLEQEPPRHSSTCTSFALTVNNSVTVRGVPRPVHYPELLQLPFDNL